jgi:hypothetical protein
MGRTPIILIAGIPATGKSSYADWLASQKGFLHLDVEKEGVLARAGLEEVWYDMFASSSVDRFTGALRRIGRPVTIDWGLPPNCLPIVELLASSGVEIWWFDGDREAARESFIKRATVPVAALDVQMAKIEKGWPDIARVFASRIIETVLPGPAYVPRELIFHRMFGEA